MPIENAPRAFPIGEVPSILFQMAFSLYAARHQAALCHYDIKLLNFLVQNVPTASLDDIDAGTGATAPQSGLGLSYSIGSATFQLGEHGGDVASPNRGGGAGTGMSRVVKLADFGTSFFDGVSGSGASSGSEEAVAKIGARVEDPRFFTTLENTPIDFLILGTEAMQGYEADTWCLGLSVVHLLTGGQPYEETLGEVACPRALDQALSQLWLSDADRYRILAGEFPLRSFAPCPLCPCTVSG